MTDPSGFRVAARSWFRGVLVLVDTVVTAAFAYGFARLWTDELVDGSPYAIADPAGTGISGSLAGALPIVVGLVLCVVLIWRTGLEWWWPVVLVAAGGTAGAILGAASRFPEGMPASRVFAVLPFAIVGAVGLVVGTWSLSRGAGLSKLNGGNWVEGDVSGGARRR